LNESAKVLAARIQELLAGLDKALVASEPHCTNQEVHKIGARLSSVEGKYSILAEKVPFVDLVVVETSAKFPGVSSDYFSEAILNLIGGIKTGRS